MAFLIPAGLFIVGLLCCIGIAFLVVQARADERKSASGRALAATTTVILATPAPSSTTLTTNEAKADVPPLAQLSEPSLSQAQSRTPEGVAHDALTTPETANGHLEHQNGHSELQNLSLFTEIEQISQLDGQPSMEWVREQIQELSVKVQDMHQQSSLIERHIALLNQIALYMNELEQVRHEYELLRAKKSAVLRIPTRLHGERVDGETYIQTDKRPSVRKYTLQTM